MNTNGAKVEVAELGEASVMVWAGGSASRQALASV